MSRPLHPFEYQSCGQYESPRGDGWVLVETLGKIRIYRRYRRDK